MSNTESTPRLLTLDIETAPSRVYVWGTWRQNVGLNQIEEPGYMMSFAAKWYGEREIIFKSTFHDGKIGMLDELWRLIDEADAVIGWNSDAFDMKHIRREFLEAGYLPPVEPKQIDLLKTARKQFKFLSNKLDYIAGRLDVGNKVKHSGFELWRDCMAGDPKAWALMKRYNKGDVKLTEEAYEILKPWITGASLNLALLGEEDHACPRCGSQSLTPVDKPYRSSAHEYEQYRCDGCGYVARAPQASSKGRKVLK